jgi:hypothetical protein
MTVAGTKLPVGNVVFRQLGSVAELGVQAGRLGLICCVSVSVGTLM